MAGVFCLSVQAFNSSALIWASAVAQSLVPRLSIFHCSLQRFKRYHYCYWHLVLSDNILKDMLGMSVGLNPTTSTMALEG